MINLIGIAHGSGDPWYMISFLLYNRMIKITAYTKYKHPKYYWYNKEAFSFVVNESDNYDPDWFIGIQIRRTTVNGEVI